MNNISVKIELIIVRLPNGNISVTGPIHNFELCMDMISSGIKLLLGQKIQDQSDLAINLILPKKRF